MYNSEHIQICIKFYLKGLQRVGEINYVILGEIVAKYRWSHGLKVI